MMMILVQTPILVENACTPSVRIKVIHLAAIMAQIKPTECQTERLIARIRFRIQAKIEERLKAEWSGEAHGVVATERILQHGGGQCGPL
jgi:tRNA A37 threonylcarbamoyladenosine dehydratase